MSRSFRKNTIIKYGGLYGTKCAKRYAAKAVRRAPFDHIKNGSMYKKFFPQWDIYDYRDRFTRREWLKSISCYKRGKLYFNPHFIWSNSMMPGYYDWPKDYFWK